MTSWRIPTDNDFKELELYLGMSQEQVDSDGWRGTDEGAKLAGKEPLWDAPSFGDPIYENENFNLTGYEWVPGGTRSSTGTFQNLNTNAYCLTSTVNPENSNEIYRRSLWNGYSSIARSFISKNHGHNVRLVRENLENDPDYTIYASGYIGNDEKIYKTIKIGNQEWLAEPFKESKYNDNSNIPELSNDLDWENDTEGGFCFYQNDSNNESDFGRLYNFLTLSNEKNIINTTLGEEEGEEEDLYSIPSEIITDFIEISTLEQLSKIGIDEEYPLDANYKQINNINAIETKNWNEGLGFIPIGSDTNPFTGLYNGNGYKIKYLHINKEEYSEYEDYIGFISYNSGTIKNLGLENVQISGTSYIGGICGYNDGGLIERVYVSGKINGLEDYIGGICGYTTNNEIINAINNAEISGGNYVGGLIGYNENTIIEKSLSTGLIFGDGQEIGGLIGYSVGELDIIKSYWDIETSTQSTSSGGTGHTTQELTYPYANNVYEDWDFVNFISNDFNNEISNGYPYLWFAEPDRSLTVEYFVELRDPTGKLIAPLKWSEGVMYEIINEPTELHLTLPFNNYLDEEFTPVNEIRLYDSYKKLIDRFFPTRIDRYGGETDQIRIVSYGPLYLLRRIWVDNYFKNGTVEEILTELLNKQPVENRILDLEFIDDSIKTQTLYFQIENNNLLYALNELLNLVGGFIRVDKNLKIHWTLDIGEDKGQQIQLSKNLIDVEWEKDTTELVNKLFLKGSLTNGLRVEIPEPLINQESINKYGLHERTFIREDILDQTELENEAQRLLDELSEPKNIYRINAVDIAKQREIDNSFYEWKLGNKIRIINNRINLDIKNLRILEIERNLHNPLESSINLGKKTVELTDTLTDLSQSVSRLRRETEGISGRVPEGEISEYTARLFAGNDIEEINALTEESPPEIDEFRKHKDFAFTILNPNNHLHVRTGEQEWSLVRADNRMYIEATLNDIWDLQDQPGIAFEFEAGDRAYTTNDKRFYIYNGTNWDLVHPIFVENTLSDIEDLENEENLNISFKAGDRAFTKNDKLYWIFTGDHWRPADSIWRDEINNLAVTYGDFHIALDDNINEYKIKYYDGSSWKNLTHFDDSAAD